jgi:hypothetical protein
MPIITSYYRARYYDTTSGRFTSEDPIGFDSGQNNFYAYAWNSPVRSLDPFGLAHCVFFLNIGTANGAAICYPDNPNDDPFAFPPNSGNNGDPAQKCQNNPACPPNDHWSVPVGPYRFGGPSISHKSLGGIHLIPVGKNNQYGADGRFLTHWCLKALDSQTKPGPSGHFCSEGCIVSTPDNIKALNNPHAVSRPLSQLTREPAISTTARSAECVRFAWLPLIPSVPQGEYRMGIIGTNNIINTGD